MRLRKRLENGPVVLLVGGVILFSYGAWLGIHTAQLRMQGVTAPAFVVHVTHARGRSHTVLSVGSGECTVTGDFGDVGHAVPVHHALGDPSDCAVAGSAGIRYPFLWSVIGLVLLGLSYGAFDRSRRGDPSARFWRGNRGDEP